MNDIQTRVGIDFRGDLFYVARIDHAVGRQEVKALMRLERQHLGDHHLLQGGQPVLAIADENIIVKKLVVNGNHDTDLRTRFELAQTLPRKLRIAGFRE